MLKYFLIEDLFLPELELVNRLVARETDKKLKLNGTFSETEQLLSVIHHTRNRYINEALAFYNKLQKKKLVAKKLEKESKLIQKESLKVLQDGKCIVPAEISVEHYLRICRYKQETVDKVLEK